MLQHDMLLIYTFFFIFHFSFFFFLRWTFRSIHLFRFSAALISLDWLWA